jgi:hypothetical protein
MTVKMTTEARFHETESVFKTILPEDIEWKPFAAFPASARLAVAVGDPSAPGPYVIRVKVPRGVKLMPHRHPEDRVYTIISGVFTSGWANSSTRITCMPIHPEASSFWRQHIPLPLGKIRGVCEPGNRDRPAGPRISELRDDPRSNSVSATVTAEQSVVP